MRKVVIYTDGSCSVNPGPGGWAASLNFVEEGVIKSISGSVQSTTNNKMELLAPIKALQELTESFQISLYTDSQYVKNGITIWRHKWEQNNWRTSNKKEVKNMDLWKELIKQTNKHFINWFWIKGHDMNLENNRVDKLARDARMKS